MKRVIFGLLSLGACSVWACHHEGERPTTTHESVRTAHAGFDLARLVERERYAFRPSEEGFSAGDPRFGVRVSLDGRVTFESVRAEPAPTTQRALRKMTEAPRSAATMRFSTHSQGTATLRQEQGELVIQRGEVEEHLSAKAEGIEQSWRFVNKPGRGITVMVDAEGLRFQRSDERGLHFQGDGGVGVGYSHATFVDATGKRTHVPAAFDGHHIVLSVGEETTRNAVFPAVLDPIISPEVDLNPTPLSGEGLATSVESSSAANGAQWFVAWSDFRGTDRRIYGAYVSPTGVDSLRGFSVSSGSAGRSHVLPRVAWNGTAFLVIWHDLVSGNGASVDLYGALVTPGVGNSAPFLVSKDGGGAAAVRAQAFPAVGCNPTTGSCLVAFEDARDAGGFGQIYGSIVTSAGAAGANFAISGSPSAAASYAEPTVAWNGSAFAVAWGENAPTTNGWGIYGTVVPPAGAPVASPSVVIDTATDERGPAVARVDSTHLAFLYQEDTGSQVRVRGVGTNENLTTLTPSINFGDGTRNDARPTLAFNGTDLWGAWQRTGAANDAGAFVMNTVVMALRWNTTNNQIASAQSEIANTGLSSDLEFETSVAPLAPSGNTDTLVSWSVRTGAPTRDIHAGIYAGRTGGGDALALRDGAGGTAGFTFPVSVRPEEASHLAVASDNQNRLVVAWSDTASGPSLGPNAVIRAAAFDVTPGQAPLQVGDALYLVVAGTDLRWPTLAYNGQNYVLAWMALPDAGIPSVQGAILGLGAGGLLPGATFSIASGGTAYGYPKATALTGTSHVLLGFTALTAPAGALHSQIGVTRVDNAGATSALSLLGSPAPMGNFAGQVLTGAASSASEGLFGWTSENSATGDSDVLFARANASGQWLDTAPVALLGSTSLDQFDPAISFGNGAYAVLWTDGRNRNSNQNYDVFAALIAPGAAPAFIVGTEAQLTPPSATSTAPQWQTTVAYDGTHFAMGWVDGRNTSAGEVYGLFARSTTTSLAPVPEQWNNNGTLSGYGLPLDATKTNVSFPIASRIGGGRVAMVYGRATGPTPLVDHPYLRIINGVGAACGGAVEPSQCAPGFLCSGSGATVCTDSASTSDAGLDAALDTGSDATVISDGAVDSADASAGDAGIDGETDAGQSDGGDSGPMDDGAVSDARPRDAASDARTGDAATTDAQASDDGGRKDAASDAFDAASIETAPWGNTASGCGCRLQDRGQGHMGTIVGLGLAVAALRRRKEVRG